MNSDKLGEIKMTNRNADTSLRQAAIVAGGAIIIMALAAGFAVSFVFESVIVPGDATATANNIKASEMLFRIGIFSWLIIFICDVLAAWGLYVFLKPVNKSLSLLTAWLSNLIQLSSGKELWFSPGVESVVSIILMFAIGYWLHQRRKNE